MEEKIIIDSETGYEVGQVFRVCKGCERIFHQGYEGEFCSYCGGELEEINLLSDAVKKIDR